MFHLKKFKNLIENFIKNLKEYLRNDYILFRKPSSIEEKDKFIFIAVDILFFILIYS